MFSCRDEKAQTHTPTLTGTRGAHSTADNEQLMSGDVITTNTQLPATNSFLHFSPYLSPTACS